MRTTTLYHGSDTPVPHPQAGRNTGFADLGNGFYLTDDLAVAQSRARSRARHMGAEHGFVSVYEFDENCVPWVTWGSATSTPAGTAFGLCFDTDRAGIAHWMRYIQACRVGRTTVGSLGSPAVVRAWIATEEVEMACSGMVTADEMAEFIDPTNLVVQYCLLDQDLIDQHLHFVKAE